MAFLGRVWDGTGGRGSVGRVTHWEDAAADWRGALPSMRVEEEMESGVELLEAMASEKKKLKRNPLS